MKPQQEQEQAEGVVGVDVKPKEKKKPGRKSKKGLESNPDGSQEGGVEVRRALRKRPERNLNLEQELLMMETGEVGDKQRGGAKKRAKTQGGKEGGSKSKRGHTFRRLRDQENLSTEQLRQWIEEISMMCHQCQRRDKGRVVRCRTCKTKRYCIPCVENWYPYLSEDAIAEACPYCIGNCNCKACLRLDLPIKNLKNQKLVLDKDTKVEHYKYLIHVVLPSLKRIHDEQIREMAEEARIKGEYLNLISTYRSLISVLMIVDIATTAELLFMIITEAVPTSNCEYDLCLTCCWEIREGKMQLGKEDVTLEYVSRGFP